MTVRFEESNERLILANYGHNRMVGFRERCGQSLVKVGQTRSNLIDGLETVGNFDSILDILEVWGYLAHFRCFKSIVVTLVVLGVF